MDVTIADLAAYGPMAFGLIALLVIWKSIVVPELRRSRNNVQDLQRIASLGKETAEANRATAELLVATSSAARGTAYVLKECMKLVIELQRQNHLPTPEQIEADFKSETEP
jgi:hypothetical protein